MSDKKEKKVSKEESVGPVDEGDQKMVRYVKVAKIMKVS